MNRTFIGGALALALAAPILMAQPKPKSKGEIEALQAMFKAPTDDARIAAAENVLTKYADTEFKAVALFFETASYEHKGDWENTIVYGERTIEADPKHFQALIILAKAIVQHTKEFDLDRDEKLAKVDKYANSAIDVIQANPPKPNAALTDEQWAAAKKDYTSQAHEILGMVDMVRKKPADAEKEFKIAIDDAAKPDPATEVRLGMALRDEAKYDEAVATFDKVMATPDVLPQVRQYAQAERVRTLQKKGALKPASSAAPAAAQATPAAPTSPAPPATPPKQ